MKTILLFFVFLFQFPSFSQDTLNIEKEIFYNINNYRVKIGKSKFTYNNSLVNGCRSHSTFMGKNNNLVHVKDLMNVGASAEIIQLNYTLDRSNSEIGLDVLKTFINSPPHKKVIEGNYTKISVGVYVTNDDDLWVTIRFI